MSRVILLDTHPLSKVTHPKIDPKVQQWLKSLQENETVIRVPEIADYELRRELLRHLQLKSFDRVIVVTTNLKHVSRFKSEEIFVVDWQQTLNELV